MYITTGELGSDEEDIVFALQLIANNNSYTIPLIKSYWKSSFCTIDWVIIYTQVNNISTKYMIKMNDVDKQIFKLIRIC